MVKHYANMIPDWWTKVTLGQFGDMAPVHKFGRNPDVSTAEEDIWNVGGKETLLTSAASMFVSCEDNTNGIGQTILVSGLDENWQRKSETVVLNGHTQVQIGAANSWTRVFRAYQVSAEPDPVGDVWIAESDTLTLGVPDTITKVHGKIEYTDAAQQTEKAMITVPAGVTCIMYGFHGSILNPATGAARSASVYVEVQELATGATVESPSWAPWRRIDQHTVSTNSTEFEEQYRFPQVFEQLTNIHIRADASASSAIKADADLLFLFR